MDLEKNPFNILSASPHDTRERIMELADERSLLFDASECMAARSILTNPRKRLSAEVAWLLDMKPKRVEEMLLLLKSSPRQLLIADKMTPTTRANLLAAGLTCLTPYNADDIVTWILQIAQIFEDIDPEELCVNINKERIVSGFPEVPDISAVEAEIQERRQYYRKVIKSALDKLPSKELVKAVTTAVESATHVGEKQCPVLLVDIVDDFEVEAQAFLDNKEENIKTLVDQIRDALSAKQPDATLALMVDQLIQSVKNWDTIAQPIQVSAKSQGLDHVASIRVAYLVRSLAVHMFNKYKKLESSRQLTNMLQEVFAEVVSVAERTAKDAFDLSDIAELGILFIDNISSLCETALENAAKNPSAADVEIKKVLHSAPFLINNLPVTIVGFDILDQGRDKIALALMHCTVIYGEKTGNWKLCVTFLENAFSYSINQEVKGKIQDNINIAKKNIKYYITKVTLLTIGIIVVIFALFIVLKRGQSNKIDSYNPSSSLQTYSPPQNSPSPAVQTLSPPKNTGLQYAKPPVGTSNILSVAEIRWCIRERIRLEAVKNIFSTNDGIDKFNMLVDDYNSRCGSYKYRKYDQSNAERDVAPYHSQIASEALLEAKQFNR